MAKKKSKKNKPHPEALDKVQKVMSPQEKQIEFAKDTIALVETDVKDRESRDSKLLRWYKKRYGIRPSVKNTPFVGASNTHIYLTDEKMRGLKPNYTNLSFEGDPVATFMPVGETPLKAAQNAEIFMHWLLMFYMAQARGFSYFKSMALGIDRMLERGKGYVKVFWDYNFTRKTRFINLTKLPKQILEFIYNPLTTDNEIKQILYENSSLNPEDKEDKKECDKALQQLNAGETVIRFKERIPLYNGPRVMAIDDKDLILPRFTTCIQTALRICHILHYSENDLKKEERSGKFANTAKVIDNRKAKKTKGTHQRADIYKMTSMTTLEQLKKSREGIGMDTIQDELYHIYEIYTYYDIDNDGIEEKVVLDVDPNTGTILRFIEFPYDHEKWPFVVFDYEFNDDRFYSQRGVPELLDHYQTIVTNQENAKQDRMRLANSLQFKYRINSVNMSQMRFIPGQGLGVKRMEDLQELKIANLDISYDREMDKIQRLAEKYVGQPDFSLGGKDAGRERRTAFEVSEAVNSGKQIFSFDARLFKDSLQDLYDQIFELWMQYGPNNVWFKVVGQDDPINLTKEQMLGNFVIVPNGEITLLSKTLEEQKAFALLELASKDQSGAVDQYNAWENYMLKFDPRAAKRILRKREEYDQIQQMKIAREQEEHAKKMEIAGRTPSANKAPGGVRLGQAPSGMRSGSVVNAGGGRQV